MNSNFDTPVKCPSCDQEYNHIKKVEVMNGDDFCYKTGSVTLTANGDSIVVEVEPVKPPEKTTYRMRNELGVVITYECEFCSGEFLDEYENPGIWGKSFFHHKGMVYETTEMLVPTKRESKSSEGAV